MRLHRIAVLVLFFACAAFAFAQDDGGVLRDGARHEAVVAQRFGQGGDDGGELVQSLHHVVHRGVEAGEDAHVGWAGAGRRRDGVVEDRSAPAEVLVHEGRRIQGVAVGGVAGGVTGFLLTKDSDRHTQIAAVFAGVTAGAVIGGVIGDYMDKSDQKRIQKALKEVPTNKSRNWTNPQTGHRFTIKPISDIATDSDGQKYREATLYARKKHSTKLDVTTKKMYL